VKVTRVPAPLDRQACAPTSIGRDLAHSIVTGLSKTIESMVARQICPVDRSRSPRATSATLM
jgi:hypothetical protein